MAAHGEPSTMRRGLPTRPPGRLIVVTDREQSSAAGRRLTATVAAAAGAGAPLVLFREKDLCEHERLVLGREVAGALAGTATRLIVASDAQLAAELGAWGVHLAAADPLPAPTVRGADLPFGRSCHAGNEVASAAGAGAAWVTLSPVFPSASKPGYGPTLGTEALAGHATAVFALGGVTLESAGACVAAGAYGVAVMGAVMAAADPAGAVHHLLRCIATATPTEPAAT